MRNLTATLCLTIALLVGSTGSSFALPECEGSPLVITNVAETAEWDNCEGAVTFGPSSKWAGAKYIGEYRNGKPNGQGTYTYASGSKYVGEFRNGTSHGQGTYTWNADNLFNRSHDGKYVGEYRNGKPNGQGTYTYATGAK